VEQEEAERAEAVRNAALMKPKMRQGGKPRPKSLHESALSAAEARANNLSVSSNHSSHMNLAGDNRYHTDTDSGLGRATPPRRAPSPGSGAFSRYPISPSGHASLPPGLVSGRRAGLASDNASDTCSTTSTMEYTGPKLFKQPTSKSNRNIVINAINTSLAGAVNMDTKQRVLDEIGRSDSKHFLILFRDAGLQFRALYSYNPEKDEVFKLIGTGPKQVVDSMFDRFYKYNSGGKTFLQIHTKHLTVTIDAFTIQSVLWQTRRPAAGARKDIY